MRIALTSLLLVVCVHIVDSAALGQVRPKVAPGTSSAQSQGTINKSLGDHYLLLVTSVHLETFTPDSVAQFDQSAYEGVAVPFLGAYETGDVPSAATMEAKMVEWKKITKKDTWPWIYLNRMIGADPARKAQFEKMPYFTQIQGADLEDKVTAQKDFLKYWQNALHAAKNAQSPGIVVDLEFYNYYQEYDIGVLARQAGKKPQETVELLRQLGHQMADVAAREYPTAAIWFLFTDLGNPSWKMVDGQPYYAAPAYIVQGLLNQIQSSHAPIKVISGGEVSLGYCHTSLEQLQMKIRNRATGFAPQLQKYPGILELAGTITLWSDPASKSDWIKDRCAPSDASTVEDLQPYLELLLKTYRYNWIYASGNGGYYAFQPKSQRFDAVIGKAKVRTQKSPSQ